MNEITNTTNNSSDPKDDEDEYYDTEDESYGPLRKRIDFITHLPYEVVDMILSELSTVELFECLEVSPTWLDILQKLPNLWYEVTVDDENYTMVDQLSLIGKHIRKYRIYNGCQEIHDGSVTEILCGSMNHLESLAWDCSDFIDRDVLNCIRHLQGSLTELEIVYTHDTRYVLPFNIPNLSSILHACPTLKRLEVSLHDSNITQYSDKPGDNEVPDNVKLTHLHWHPGAYTTIEELEKLLVVCPLLLYMSIGSFEDSVSILAFRSQCPPKLRYLHLDVNKHSKSGLYSYSSNNNDNDNNHDDIKPNNDFFTKEEEEEERRMTIKNNNKNVQNKLESLSAKCYNQVDWEELLNLIRMDQKSLKDLTVCHNESSFDLTTLLDIFQGSFLSLRYSYIYWRSRGFIHATLNKYIVIDNQQEKIQERNSDKKKQQQLTIQSEFETSTYQQRHLPWFIEGLRGTHSRSFSWKVSKLKFCDCIINTTYIQSLLELSTLEELSITTSKRDPLEIEALTALIDGLCVSRRRQQQQQQQTIAPRIRRLCLGSVTGLTDGIVARFAEINELKDLTLMKCNDITDQGIIHLVDSESSLEKLSVLECKNITSEAKEYIKEKLDQREYQQKQ
ncbi:hypothetical protein INT45_007579 [Circinella minor]|uniref:F-box domain-containing protein n=1 Tax=Circinella minor TaxID=1195481 RepID=A0A8H7VMQ3_9FUNG|nr:hypothetical protein INT45_007579 [Circinella minor]